MSIEAVSWVMRHSRASGVARNVLTVIAWHADRTGRNSWPSQETIAREANTSARRVRTSVAALRRIGELKAISPAKKSRGKSYCYSLTLVSNQIDLPLELVPVPRGTPRPRDTTSPGQIGPGRGTPRPPNCPELSYLNSNACVIGALESIPIQPCMAFVGMCRRKGRVIDKEAVPLLKRRLIELEAQGHSPAAVLEQSVMRGWLSLHPIEDERRNQKNGTGKGFSRSPAAVAPSPNRRWKEPTILSNV
jgi:Helix-turn-helix domain